MSDEYIKCSALWSFGGQMPHICRYVSEAGINLVSTSRGQRLNFYRPLRLRAGTS